MMPGDSYNNCSVHEIKSRIMMHRDWIVLQVSAGWGCTVCYRDTKQLQDILVAASLQKALLWAGDMKISQLDGVW